MALIEVLGCFPQDKKAAAGIKSIKQHPTSNSTLDQAKAYVTSLPFPHNHITKLFSVSAELHKVDDRAYLKSDAVRVAKTLSTKPSTACNGGYSS